MRICAVSDLHGRLPDIPKCDVLILGGDICPDIERVGWDADLMKMRQTEWLGDAFSEWAKDVPAEFILATPGNHDWISAFPDNCRAQMFIDQGVEVYNHKVVPLGFIPPNETALFKTMQCPVKFWFTPWVQHCGDWNYMANREQRRYYFDNIPPKLDVLVTHAPAFGCGDLTYSNEPAGCREMRQVVQRQQPRIVLFGHIHEGQRYGREERLGGSKLFNIAMWGQKWSPLVFDIEDKG